MKTIKMNDKDKDVRFLCSRLSLHGYPVTAGDLFTPELKEMVMHFQKLHKLTPDGIVGFDTWEALLFAGAKGGEKLTEENFVLAALLLNVEKAALKAVQQVETAGRGGFFAPGKPAILFEGHIFWRQLGAAGIDPVRVQAGNEDILYPRWTKEHYKGGLAEYERLEKARSIHRRAADASASWGMFQIMGFNHAACGEESVESFVRSMCESELRQLLLTARFIRKSGMLPYLEKKDWAGFAMRYNGPGYEQNQYDRKLREAYEKQTRP